MKNFKYIILFVMLKSCGIKTNNEKETKASCNENLKFKEIFFQHIKNIEGQIHIQMDDSFDPSLKFISNYTHVSFESMTNYSKVYPIGVFETDKIKWLKWYEDNKCNNIQFKDNQADNGTD